MLRCKYFIYGVTTGFGALSDVVISKEDTRQLQENVLLSHAAGIGRIIDEETRPGPSWPCGSRILPEGSQASASRPSSTWSSSSTAGVHAGDAGEGVGGGKR
jgi:hypothetical protein